MKIQTISSSSVSGVVFSRATLALSLVLSVACTIGCTENNSTAANPAAAGAPAPAKAPTPAGQAAKPAPARAPAKLIRSDYKVGEVALLCQAAMDVASEKLDAIAKLPEAQRTVDSTLLTFETVLADLSDDVSPLTFMGYVSTDAKVSAEGSACEEKLGAFTVGLFTRRDLYDALKAAKVQSANQARLQQQTVKAFERNGLNLSDSDLAKVKAMLSLESSKESKFSANLNADTSSVEFTADQLKGVPTDSLARFKKAANGNYIVTTKSTDYVAVNENAVSSQTRHDMMLAYLNRGGPENTKLLQEATALRSQIAKMLGYDTWADYKTSDSMAKDKKTVLDFLNGLKDKLAARNASDLAKLLAFKQESDPSAKTLDQWDIGYYSNQLKKRDYVLDDEQVREYFPAEVVIDGLFAVYSRLLGVTYKEVTTAKNWSSDVKLYEIHNAKDDSLIGYFYTDFFPRAGKYGHAAAFPLIAGRTVNGLYSLPVASIVANFTPPTADKPSLLLHDEVETIFHEFGHIMHQTLTTVPYASLSGSAVARDFVEAPSQMLENFVWQPEVLNLISGHYKDHSQKLPKELLDKMLAARDFGQGLAYTKQLLYALFDMTIHTGDGSADVTQTYDSLYRQIVGQEPLSGAHFAGTFGHMMGGYDAGYYGYLWSEVYAQDMFSIFEAGGLLNPAVGAHYRSTILEQGSMKDAIAILKEFLGRDPSPDAFFKKLKI